MDSGASTKPDDVALSAGQIELSAFRQILWLPLRCGEEFDAGRPAQGGQRHWVAASGDWLHLPDQSPPSLPTDGAGIDSDDYATYLYFHPFVRRFLFGAGSGPPSGRRPTAAAGATTPLTIWQLADPAPFALLDVLLPDGQPFEADGPTHTLRYHLVRCRLYHFKPVGVAMLEIELEGANQLLDNGETAKPTLARILDALDFLRRTHPSYLPTRPHQLQGGGRYPLNAVWRTADAPALPLQPRSAPDDRRCAAISLIRERDGTGFATPLDLHWKDLLGPLADSAQIAQLEDERMPYMAYLAVPDPRRISRGDWVRLAFADYHGDSGALPYGCEFLENFERDHCYDRYFSSSQRWMTTRYLNTGYAFTMVGSDAKDGFFLNDGLVHFRRQYACMGLLAQFNKAALLNFSDQLSEALDVHGVDRQRYRREVHRIQRELLAFTHRHWFDGVSNQLQAGELYAMWSRHLGLKPLFDAVTAEARAAHDLVLAEDQAHQSAQTDRIARGGLAVALAALFLSLLGTGFPIDKPLALVIEGKADVGLCWLTEPGCHFSLIRLILVFIALVAAIKLYDVLDRLRRESASASTRETHE